VLYLDEPTTGLDPRSRSDVWHMVRALVADGVTVLLTTQYLDEADRLAHDIVVIDHGKVIATGTPGELKDKSGGQVLEVAAAVIANRTGSVPDVDADAGLVRVPVADAAVLPAIIRELDEARVELAEFTLRKASLDEVFLALTGRDPADIENDGDKGKTRELEGSPR
jgi:ABC-type multidrug transport system ATPase subunit